MANGLFVTATGTDVGKTYISALLVKALRRCGRNAGYYKPIISGAPAYAHSDAAYVNDTAGLNERKNMLLSYRYSLPAAPHLAARVEGNPPEKSRILRDWHRVCTAYDYVTAEGCGGILCPIRMDEQHSWYVTDLIGWLSLPSVIVVPAGLGAINAAALTAFYMTACRLPVKGYIVNEYTGTIIERDTIYQIEKLTSLPVWACVRRGDTELHLTEEELLSLYQ